MKAARPFVLLALLALSPQLARAQGVRIQGITSVRYIEVRPLRLNVDPATTQEPVGLVPLTQDLFVNAWGLGQGMRLYAHVRARAALGDTAIWPQSDDAFDALAAYVEADRSIGRIRIGRQWTSSHLGYYNYDGAAVLWRPYSWFTGEVYGGWALAPGLNEFLTSDALAAVEPFAPDRRSNLIGAQVRFRVDQRFNAGAEYQREIRTDRAGLYGERVAGEAAYQLRRARAEASVEVDLASYALNDGKLRLILPTIAGVRPTLEARRYLPYFQLWTIWGAFSPVGFNEAGAQLDWSTGTQSVTVSLSGGYRDYRDDHTDEEVFGGLKADGWRAGAYANWRLTPTLGAWGSYQAEINFGASLSQGDVGVRLALGRGGYVSASAIAFQLAHELQVREGTVLGLSTDAGVQLAPNALLNWNFALYRHLNSRGLDAVDWNQLRATVQLEWSLGSDPGLRVARRTQ